MDTRDTELTAREAATAGLVAEGLTIEAVASRLCISVNTVKTHLKHVYRKLGVRNRAQITAMMLERRKNHPNG